MKTRPFIDLIWPILLTLLPLLAVAQFQGDRLSVRISSGYNFMDGRFEPAALSVAVESRYRYNKWLSVGGRYESGVRGISEKRNLRNRNIYQHGDAHLSRLNIYSLQGYLHFRFLGASVQAGPGLEYVRTQPRVIREFSVQGHELLEVVETGAVGLASVNLSMTVDVGRAFMGFRTSSLRYENDSKKAFYNFSLGYRIFQSKLNFEEVTKPEQIPVFFLEFGVQPMVPFAGEAKASAIGTFIEPKFSVAKRWSVGFRYDLGLARSKAFDNDNEFGLSTTSGSLLWRQENRMAETSGVLGTVDYYFPTQGGWYFIGAGFGQYTQDELQGFSSGGFFQQTNFTKIPEVKNYGFMFRAGIKMSLLRFGINANFTGSGISDYIGLQVGVEPSFMRNN